jgi:hypothetical protein
LFYEKGKREQYNKVIDAMHAYFAGSMDDKTGDIATLMGVQA